MFIFILSSADIDLIQEGHTSETDVSFWRSQWEGCVVFIWKSAGVAVLKGSLQDTLSVLRTQMADG